MLKKNKKLNILILTHTYSDLEAGGESKIVRETSQALARAGLNIFVVAARVNLNNKDKEKNLKVYQAPFCRQISVFNQGNMFKVFLFSLFLIISKRIDIIHLMPEPGPCPFVRFKVKPLIFSSDTPWDYDNLKYGEDLKYDRAKKNEEKKMVQFNKFHQKVFDKLVNYFYLIFNLKETYPRNVDLYTCTGKKLIEKLKSEGYKSKLVHVQWGVNPKIFHPQVKPIKKDKDKFLFLFAGSIGKRKGVEYLIKAFKKVSQNRKNIELWLIGNGAYSTVEYFKELAQGVNIKFIDEVLPNDIPKYLTSADVFIAPSLGEPFGLLNLEAMACGKPVISSRAGGVVDFFKDGEIGFLVEPANVDEIKEAMEKFLDNPNLAKEMGSKALIHVLNNYTWDMTAKNMIKAYNLLYEKRKP